METPRLISNAFQDKDADIIGIAALVLGILLGEWNATTVTLCMLTGGEALERACMKNAEHSLEMLLQQRIHIDTCEVLADNDSDEQDSSIDKRFVEVKCADIKVGSRYVLRKGSVVPVDSEILEGEVIVDDSALTGENAAYRKISNKKKKTLLSGSKILAVNTSSGIA